MHARTQERGFALAGAVFSLVIIAALVVGAFFASRQELNIGRASQTYQRAFQVAEASMNKQVALWNTSANALTVGDSLMVYDTITGSGGGTAVTAIKRLNTQLFLMRTTGTSGTSSRTLATLTRLQLVQMNFLASLTTQGSIQVGGSSYINGVNTPPAGWSCPTPTDTVAAVRTPDSNQITTSGCNSFSCLSGNPKISQDTTVADSTFFQFGNLDWAALTAMATKTYVGDTGPLNSVGPVAVGSTCTTTTQDNWGEPWRSGGSISACYNYMPIIYVSGNLKLTGGRGQGILLVEGDLSVQGGFEFYGPVIARGQFDTQGTGGHFTGGVMAANVNLQVNNILGNALITYSSCAISRALQFNASGRGLRERSWAEVTF